MKLSNLLQTPTKKQCSDFGLVAVLVCTGCALYFHTDGWVKAAFLLALVTVVVPILFYPFAAIWFALSHLLGQISTTILLLVVFFLMVVPVGLFRRLAGKDTMLIRRFKKDRGSVWTERDHRYGSTDLSQTF